MLGIVVAGVLGNLVGSWIAYGVGRGGRLELVERHGHWLHLKPSQIDWADRWFERYGAPAVFFSRMLPIIRTFISLAGRRRADAVRALHAASRSRDASRGCSGSRSPDKRSATNWKSVRKGFEYVDYAVVILVVIAIVYAVIRRRRRAEPTLATRAGRRLKHRAVFSRAPDSTLSHATRSPSACCRARPSCCRSPPRPTRR